MKGLPTAFVLLLGSCLERHGVGDEWVNPIKQQLRHLWFPQVLDAATLPPLDQVRVVGFSVKPVIPAGTKRCGCLEALVRRNCLKCSPLWRGGAAAMKNPAIADGVQP